MSAERTQSAVERLLGAIQARDLRAISAAISPDATWQNVPNPMATGRDEIVAMLATVVCWSDEVRWEIASASFGDGIAWLERTDRFVIEGVAHTVLCNGVFLVDADLQQVTGVRDYVDLGEWRARIDPVLERLANRSAIEVVRHHLDAVARLDPIAMAADYSIQATLTRGPGRHNGWAAIADYFDTVPTRLGTSTVAIESVDTISDDRVQVNWRIGNAVSTLTSGTDTYVVADGRIIEQRVDLDGDDFSRSEDQGDG